MKVNTSPLLQGELLNHHAQGKNNFVGHIGGDDFVVIFRSADWRECCERIICEFDAQVRAFYSSQDLQCEGIEALDRNGSPTFYPLLGLAIGVVHPDASRCDSHNEVAELATQAKKKPKRCRTVGCLSPAVADGTTVSIRLADHRVLLA
ncbi:hypothetical protein QKW35_01460 [Pontibacterium granulatum]|uniref:hypothetical protein n=1 Tax=Pontibacterium granulatum TaxID=2036029 RepID=UPI00249C3C39|nr:hypothetical protein [Pontibacterium granulatum]MDI3323030.1 hypothetical protein [Pontibacterium granulatum]